MIVDSRVDNILCNLHKNPYPFHLVFSCPEPAPNRIFLYYPMMEKKASKNSKDLLFLLALLRLHTRYPFSTACKSSQYFYFTGMFFCFFIITDSKRQYAPGISFPFRHLSLEPQSIFFLFNLRNRFFRCMIYHKFRS